MKRNRTHTAIMEAFADLLCEHPIDRITVKMITDKVGCSRKTFYYYFADVYALTHYLCEQKVNIYLKSGKDTESIREEFQGLMNYLNCERQVVLNMFRGFGKEELESFAWKATNHYTRTVISRRPEAQNLSEEEVEAVAHMYSYMLFGMLVDWISKGMDSDYARALDISLKALPLILNALSEKE